MSSSLNSWSTVLANKKKTSNTIQIARFYNLRNSNEAINTGFQLYVELSGPDSPAP